MVKIITAVLCAASLWAQNGRTYPTTAINFLPNPTTLVQHANMGSAGDSPKTLSFSVGLTAGNAAVIFVAVDQSAPNCTASSTPANTWLTATDGAGGTGGRLTVLYALNVAASTNSIIVTCGTSWISAMAGFEIHNSAGLVLDQAGSDQGYGTTASASTAYTVDLTAGTEYMLLGATDWNHYNAWTAGSNYTMRELVTVSGGNYLLAVQDSDTQTGLSGVQTPSMTKSVSGSWSASVVTFASPQPPNYGYNGHNYTRSHLNGRTYSPCLSFYPVDVLLTFNGAGVGTTSTTNNLNASSEPMSAMSWATASTYATYGPSLTPLPGSVKVNREVTPRDCGSPGQSLVLDDTHPTWMMVGNLTTTDKAVAVVSGFINSGPNSGGYDSIVFGLLGGAAEAIQIGPAVAGSACGTANHLHMHNSGDQCILLNPETTYYFSYLIDDSSPSAISKFALYTDATGTTKVGEVDWSDGQTATLANISPGNNESSTCDTCTGRTTTIIQWIMVDYTNHVWPNVLH